MPQLRFRGQPLAEADTAGSCLCRILSDYSIASLSIAVAWARFGGLARLEPFIDGFRGRGGVVTGILGIDEGVASRPGLRKAVEMLDRVFILHDPSGRTFHPKVYLAEGEDKAVLLVGSSNTTAGGLFFNYEASLEAEFRLPDERHEPALTSIQRYFTALFQDTAICLELTAERIAQLLDDPRYP